MPWNSPSTGLVAIVFQDSVFMNNSVLYNNTPSSLMGFGTVYSYKVPFDINGITYVSTNNGSGIVVVGTGVNVRSGAAISFSYNVATNGGAIAAYANGWITFWDDTNVYFFANKAQSRGGAIYSESTGGHEIVESRDCMIRYFQWWKPYEEWGSRLYFERNLAGEDGDDIFISSLFPCIRSGSNGSADTSVEARKKVFRAMPTFQFSSNLTNRSIATGAASITFKVNVIRNDLHISVYPGQVLNFSTEIMPLDELGALSNVTLFATTEIPIAINCSSNYSVPRPAAEVAPNSVYTTGYLQFQVSNNFHQRHDSVQLKTVSEPALLFSFDVSLSDCPPGSYPTNNATTGQCVCAHNSGTVGYLAGIICYDYDSSLSIFRQASTWYGKVRSKSQSMNISVTGPCPQNCVHSYSSNLVPLNQTDPTSGICRDQSHGILCGTCDHGVLISSHTYECCTLKEKLAISVPAAWASWITIQISLTTMVVVVILLFDFNVIGGTLCSFVFFSQVLLDLNLPGCTSGQSHAIVENIERWYAFWSLRFRWIIPMTFCMPSFDNTLESLSLDYVFALYPFALIAFIWIIGYCQEIEWHCRCCQSLCFKFNILFNWFRQKLAQRTSLVHGIATCLILTYGDLVSISFFLLTPVKLSVPYNISDPNDIEGGPWRSFYNGDYAYFGYPHYLYGIGASIAVMLFGFLPPLFLMSYPVLPRVLRKCSIRLGDKVEGWYQKRVVHHFLDLFQGQFKDNHRYFAGMWLVYRLILHANGAFAPDCITSFAIQISSSIIFLLLHSILQPNKKTKYNILDNLFFANIALLSTLGLVFWSSNRQGSDSNAITAAMAIFLILPHLYFFCVVMYRLANCINGRCCCWGQDPGERQPFLNVATAAVNSFVGRRESSSVRQANCRDYYYFDEDDEEDNGGRKRDGLLDSVSYSTHDSSANMQGINVSEAVVSVPQRHRATDETQDKVKDS